MTTYIPSLDTLDSHCLHLGKVVAGIEAGIELLRDFGDTEAEAVARLELIEARADLKSAEENIAWAGHEAS